MYTMRLNSTSSIISTLLLLVIASCDQPDSADLTLSSESLNVSESQPNYQDDPIFTHKMVRKTNDNPPMSSLGYECNHCTFEQWKSIVPSEGWSKGTAQLLIADSGEMRSVLSHDEYPSRVNFLDEVPGEEYELIVINTGGEIIEISDSGLVVRAQVIRDTVLNFNPGRLIHVLSSPDGTEYILFAIGVDPNEPIVPNADDPTLLGDFSAPEGWIYSTEIVTNGLVLESNGVTNVIAIRGPLELTWEMR